MSLTLYRVSAFPYQNTGGNEAGVVLDAEHLSDAEMLKIAKRVNYSETAFVLQSDKADFKLRYFSPEVEVPLCGHATIATFNLMRNLDLLHKKDYTIETKEGVLNIHVYPDFVSMQLKTPLFKAIIEPKTLTDALSIDPSILGDTPIQVVSTGIPEIFVPVKTRKSLEMLEPKESAINAFIKIYDAYGIYFFTPDTVDEAADTHGRNFIPAIGIYEESATGTASGALACYINRYINPKQTTFVFEQGYTLFKPSTIQVKIKKSGDTINRVYVGGRMRFIDKIVGFNPNNRKDA